MDEPDEPDDLDPELTPLPDPLPEEVERMTDPEALPEFPEPAADLHDSAAFWKLCLRAWHASPLPSGTAAAIDALTARLINFLWSAEEQQLLS